VPEAVFRACHTLHGSLTMAGVAPGVAVAGPLHELVAVLYNSQQTADPDVLAAARAAAGCIDAIVAHLRDPEVPAPVPDELVSLLRELAARAAASAGSVAADDDGTLSVRLPAIGPGATGEGDGAAPGAMTMAIAFDAEIAGIFAEEAAELLDASDQALAHLVAGDDVEHSLDEIKRALHTLKGGARMARLFALGDLSHELESLVIRMAEGGVPRDAATLDLVRTAFDELHRLRDRVASGDFGVVAPGLLERLAAAHAAAPAEEEAGASGGVPPGPTPADAVSLAGADAAPETDATDLAPDAGAADVAEVLPEPPPVAVPPQAGTDDGQIVTPESGASAPATADDATETLAAALFGDDFLAAGEAAEPVDGPDVAAPAEALEAAPAEEAAAGPATDTTPAPLEPLAPTIERLGELARALAAPPTPEPATAVPVPAAATATPPPADARGRETRDLTRVDAQLLEQLLNGAGEISIANSRLNQQLSQMHFHLEELGQTVLRLRDQLRKLEMETEAQILFKHQSEAADRAGFDPLELDRYSSIQQLSRGLAETASDVSSLKDLLQNLSSDTEALVVQQARTTTELQDGLMRTRMVPFQQHGARLTRLVRQTAREAGKLADLVIEGGGDLDRQVLEKMLPPFEHMLRNAVVHGIEPPADRAAVGKPESGTVRITIRREGTEVVIDVADDGRGLDVGAIRRKAIELGFVATDTPLTDEQAMQFILRTGFSTADRLTQAAGRGIGMDVVANQVARLGGALVIRSQPGRGTTFTLRLPLTLAVTQALVVRVGAEVYALPLATVEGIIRLARRELDDRLGQPDASIEYGGRAYRFHHLGEFLGLPGSRLPADAERVSVVLVRAGEQAAALLTDEMQDSREIVVKSVGPQIATIRGIAGATILGDGRVVMILDVAALVRQGRPAGPAAAPPAPRPAGPVALVVDDSITMRRVTQRLLERNGFRVVTARDGIDAIGVLQDHRPDIILLDVEMPRMDGYEFARHVRSQASLAGVPIVMVTSRVSDKHRARAIEVGVNDYLGKPYQERELLQAVNALLGVAAGTDGRG
jgi:chemosensory pili system protein ChpA (sensor histidine kinase/response regulator)